jgi:hypothetical protein
VSTTCERFQFSEIFKSWFSLTYTPMQRFTGAGAPAQVYSSCFTIYPARMHARRGTVRGGMTLFYCCKSPSLRRRHALLALLLLRLTVSLGRRVLPRRTRSREAPHVRVVCNRVHTPTEALGPGALLWSAHFLPPAMLGGNQGETHPPPTWCARHRVVRGRVHRG